MFGCKLSNFITNFRSFLQFIQFYLGSLKKRYPWNIFGRGAALLLRGVR